MNWLPTFLLQYLYVFLCIHIKYRNKNWVTNSKGAPISTVVSTRNRLTEFADTDRQTE